MKRLAAMILGFPSPGGRRWLRGWLDLALLVSLGLVASCGGGGGSGGFELPSGSLQASDTGPLALFVSEAGKSDQEGTRAAGNRISGYRLGSGGLLPREPFTAVGTAENPRALVLAQGCEAGEAFSTLYVATLDRVQAYAVADSGEILPQPVSETAPEGQVDGVAMTIANNHLYVAGQGASRIDAYLLGSRGALPAAPTSCARGLSTAAYDTLAVAGDVLLAGGLGSIDSFTLSAGELPAVECTSGAVTERAGSTIVPRALDITLDGSRLYVSEEAERRIFSLEVGAAGALPLEFDSKTSQLELFERLLLDGTRLYAAAFSAGKIMAFQLEGDLLPQNTFSETAGDPDTLPVGLLRSGDFLYVAQGGADRVDAFAVDPSEGSLSSTPVSSTSQIKGSFPNDLALGQFPPPPCP